MQPADEASQPLRETGQQVVKAENAKKAAEPEKA
jgi:hypothetical protein